MSNDSTLAFNRSDPRNDPYIFDGEISGDGSVLHSGSGFTILTADNSYSGDTVVENGALFIDGDQSAAMGETEVRSGGLLSGDGIIGGNVTVLDGVIGPAGVPLTPATLTINGNLGLSEDSILFYNVVEANVAGGALNDLMVVNGGLVLDGTINIIDQGQTLAPGVYRIINYDVADGFVNNGLTIGSFVDGDMNFTRELTDLSVQTSIPGQVNLINTAGLTLNYWDGDGTPPDFLEKNNDVIDGGDGIWRNAGELATFNWTDATGDVNAPWAQGQFAIFTGAPGTVTVVHDSGEVEASGMQFMVDGYTIDGAAITLTNPSGATIVVGDGTEAGIDMTATIEAELTGNTVLIKEGLGTLVLTGDNSYVGGTLIVGGTLEISEDANLGMASTGVAIANDSTLHTTGTFTTDRDIALGSTGAGSGTGIIETDDGTVFTVDGAVFDDPSGTNPGTLVKAGLGTLVLTSDENAYDGGTEVTAGTLQIGDGGATGTILGDVAVAAGATLAFDQSDTFTFGGVISGEGALVQAGGTADTGTLILTAENTYTGGTTITGGTLQLGNGGTTGSILGDVTNDGTLVFDRSDTYVFDGAITGSGSVIQQGTGTTVLTGDSDYGGGTTITEGTLQLGDGGDTGSITGDVVNDGVLAFNRSNTYVFDGEITGTGALNQIGTGTTILTADSDYSGGTTIAQGTLQLGNGGETGSIIGEINNNGTLVFDRSDEVIFADLIRGTGDLVQQGEGTTILTANNTYSGGTTISGGTLQLGNGGESGNIIGDIELLNDSTLAFNRSDLMTIVGTITGDGNVVQDGPGTTVLLGDNSYTGSTDVNEGALFINGNQSDANGDTTVAGGATLGGTGTVGGNVIFETGGATLAPGDVGVAPGTLTIEGDLTLASDSILTYQFGQANVVGGPLNDLTVVEGDLILDGTINVETTEGGTFDPGVYRIISYSGGMTGDLTPGELPSDDFFVQTSVPQQVNLINTAGLVFNFWDGSPANKNNSVVDGGSGTWVNNEPGDDTSWTDADGTQNDEWNDSAFAIFMGAPGEVTVDNGAGQVQASGMQFVVDGYEITGEELRLVEDPVNFPGVSIIRVGDGTADGAEFVATISAVLTGDTQLVKTDLGTLVLTADNEYSGGTAINAGTVQIDRDANLGQAGTALSLNGGTLNTTASFASGRATTLGPLGGSFETDAATTFTLTGIVDGEGSLTKIGDGTMVLTADNTYAGGTVINAGVLEISSDTNLGAADGPLSFDGGTLRTTEDITSSRQTGLGEGGGTFETVADTTLTLTGVIGGTGALTKAGGGTLILTAENLYSGGTTISVGILQLGDGGETGSIFGDVENNGTLVFNRSNTYVFEGLISGTGGVEQIGTGVTVLMAQNTYEGPTTVTAGTLMAGAENAFSPNSPVTVQADGTLDLGGFDQTLPELTNAGLVRTGGAPGTVLTLTGNYIGEDGTILFNTNLGADDSLTDMLVLDGVTTPGITASGSTAIVVANVGGAGAKTTGDGIRLIEALGDATTGTDAFFLGAPAVAGPYEYSLYRGGAAGGFENDWFLRSVLDCTLDPNAEVCEEDPDAPDFRPEVSLDTAIPSLALDYGNLLLDSLDERMGAERGFRWSEPGEPANRRLAWGRVFDLAGSRDGGDTGIFSDDGPEYDYNMAGLQAGMDLYRAERASGGFDSAGLYFAYGHSSADVDHFDGTDAGSIRLDGYTLGAYWTRFGATGWYIDAVVQGTWNDVETSSRLPDDLSTDGFGFGASLESGYPFHLGNGFVLEPQAQLAFQAIDLQSGHDTGAEIRFDDVQSLRGRLSLLMSRTWDLFISETNPAERRQAVVWGRASLLNEFLGEPKTEFSSADGFVPFEKDMGGLGYKLDLGFDTELVSDVSLYGNLTFHDDFDGGNQAFGGKLGLKAKF